MLKSTLTGQLQMNATLALSKAMEVCIHNEDLRGIAVFGPRRCGTNYLQQSSLLNTLNCYTIHMDATARDHNCRLFVNGYSEYGSKHSFRDKPIRHKLRKENVNLVIIKRDMRAWLYSRYAYQLGFCKPDFLLCKDTIDKWIQREYIEFLEDLSMVPIGLCHIFIYEDMTIDSLRGVLFESGLLITRYPLEVSYATAPGGGSNGKRFKPRPVGGNEVIESYLNKRSELADIRTGADLFHWAGVRPEPVTND